MDHSTSGFPVLHYLLEFAQTHVHYVSKTIQNLILCHPLLLLPSVFPSMKVFSNESALHIKWPKCWSFCFSISPSNEYSGIISFKIDCFDLPVVLGSLKSLVVFAVQLLSGIQLLATPCTAVCQVSLSFTIFHSLLKLMPIASLMSFNYLILYHPFLLLPSIFSIISIFPVNWLSTWSGPSIGASASASVLQMNIRGWFPLRLTGLISLQSKELSRVSSSTTVPRSQFFGTHPSYCPTLTSIHDYWKNYSFEHNDLCQQSDVSAF